jgi:hypothetical protein
MANHVDNNLKVIGNHACMAAFDRIFSELAEEQGLEHAHFLPDWDGDDYPSREWMHDYIGPKWAHVDYYEEGSEFVNITSAWCSIFPFTKSLARYLEEFDPKVRVELTYIDEFINFAGCAVWANSDWDVEEEDHNYFEKEWLDDGGIAFDHEDYDAWDYRDMVDEKIHYWANEMACWMENMDD